MYSQIDRIIFPNWCEVYQTAPHQYVYPIFKNASSLIRRKQKQYGWKILVNEQLKKLTQIEIYLRDPFERYVSGVNSYIQWQVDKEPGTNQHTLLKFINDFPFIDRHFCPQYYWLCNLARYTDRDCEFLIKPLSDVGKIVDGEFHRPHTQNGRLLGEMEHMRENKFLMLDSIVMNKFMNQSATMKDINQHFKHDHTELYKDIFKTNNDIASQWTALD